MAYFTSKMCRLARLPSLDAHDDNQITLIHGSRSKLVIGSYSRLVFYRNPVLQQRGWTPTTLQLLVDGYRVLDWTYHVNVLPSYKLYPLPQGHR